MRFLCAPVSPHAALPVLLKMVFAKWLSLQLPSGGRKKSYLRTAQASPPSADSEHPSVCISNAPEREEPKKPGELIIVVVSGRSCLLLRGGSRFVAAEMSQQEKLEEEGEVPFFEHIKQRIISTNNKCCSSDSPCESEEAIPSILCCAAALEFQF